MRHAIRFRSILPAIALWLGPLSLALFGDAPTQPQRRYRRAKPPTWTEAEVSQFFFRDALKEGVLTRRPKQAVDRRAAPFESGKPTVDDAGHETTWSQLISSPTIEDEVKRLKQLVDQSVSTPGRFAGEGYVEVRSHFTTLALLFGIIHQYDGDIRWKRDAASARDLFAHSASIAKVGTIQVFHAAKQRKLDLGDLVRGARLGSQVSRKTENWGDVLDRAPLMSRLSVTYDERLSKWTANQPEFRNRIAQVVHESELAAAMGDVLTKEGMVDADDEDYVQFCRNLKQSALRIIDAAKQTDYDQARKAASVMGVACNQCHELYRG